MNTTDNYLPNATYAALVSALHQVQPDLVTGRIERHQIVELLGEVASIWPLSVLADAARVIELSNESLKVAS